jgi:hypothetical protein
MARRPTEDFVRHYDLLVLRTGNSPNAIRAALNRDGQLALSIRELDDIWRLVEQHRRFAKRRFIVQTHPKFCQVFNDYEARWKDRAMMAVMDWEAEQRGEEPISQIIDRVLLEFEEESKTNARESVGEEQHEVHEWDFDPDEHSASEGIFWAGEVLRCAADQGDEHYGAMCSRAAGALKWIQETIGLDFSEVERRWKEFPVITVPKHVSDKHGIEDPYSLFGYLTQIRLAYMIGADLAAIAMCRAVTEILIRVHYNQDDKTDLMTLIKSTQKRREGSVLRDRNIVAKVQAANDILHVNKGDIEHRDRSRALIRDWVEALQELIVRLRES